MSLIKQIREDGEIWKSVIGYPSYEVSSMGRVRSLPKTVLLKRHGKLTSCNYKGRILKPGKTKQGYLLVVLTKKDKSLTSTTVHTLAARAFLGKPPKGKRHVMHRDDDKTNNKVTNLKWCSHKENMEDKVAKGIQLKGTDISTAVLTNAKVRKAVAMLEAGKTPKVIAESFGVTNGVIKALQRGITWSHITGFTKQSKRASCH